MEFWPSFEIFHRLWPYSFSKRDVLGFHKQATHRRRGDFFFTLGSTTLDWGWPENGQFWTKNDQTRQACQVVQKGPKWSLLGPSGPFWTISNMSKRPTQNFKMFFNVAESDVDDEERVGDSLDFDVQFIEAEVWWRFPLSGSSVEILSWSLVHIWRLMFGWSC